MRLNQRHVVPNHENHSLDSARGRFFDCILDQWLAGNREHFLWNSLGGWKHTCAEARCWDDCLADFFASRHRQTIEAKTRRRTDQRQEIRVNSFTALLRQAAAVIPISSRQPAIWDGTQEDARPALERIRYEL